MTILSKNNQTGRSMVEMLGVLAIIGVLSVGGISGYSKAMAKFKLTKAQDQITMLLMNIRTAFATSPNYDGLVNDTAIDYNIAPTDMVPDTTKTDINHAFGGGVVVGATTAAGTDITKNASKDDTKGQYFLIKFDNLGNEACLSLATSDWGTDGLVRIKVAGSGGVSGDTSANKEAKYIPLKLNETGCGGKGSKNSITWIYY